MNLHSITRWTLGMLTVLMLSAVMGLAFQAAAPPEGAQPAPDTPVPEPATLVLLAIGGGGVAWQSFRSRVRK